MRRRKFIKLMGGAAVAWPLAARAQRPAMTRVGIVTIQPPTAMIFAAFDNRLRELGYVEGQNLVLDFLNPEQQSGGNAGVVEELLRRKVDVVLVAYESTLKAALAVRATLPMVMIAVDYDPIAHGYVESLARPGGNVTGLYLQQIDLARKRVELLMQALPMSGLSRSSVLAFSHSQGHQRKSRPGSICNWTRRERWKPIARRSGYRSRSSAEDQINACS